MKENRNDHQYGKTSSGQEQTRNYQANASNQRSRDYSSSEELDDMDDLEEDDDIVSLADEDEDDFLDDDDENSQMNRRNGI